MPEAAQAFQDLGAIKKVLVVGAGVAGLQVTRQLLSCCGFQVLVLESNNDIGGVWMENYVGFSLQVPWRCYQFPDFLWPRELQPSQEYPTGQEVHAYIKAYAAHFDLLRHVQLNCTVVRLLWDPAPKTWHAVYYNSEQEKFFKVNADYVVMCSGIYSNPFIPSYSGTHLFSGTQLHAKDFTDMSLVRGRRVLIVGSGKTALDCVCGVVASRSAASVTMLYRQAHWPVPRNILGVPIRRLLFNRATAAMLSPYYTAGSAERAVARAARPLRRLFWRSLEFLISRKFRLANKLSPHVSLPDDLFYGGQILDDRVDKQLEAQELQAVRGEINCFVRNGVILQDGSFRGADVVLYCTGYEKSYDYFDPEMRARLGLQKDGLYLYRNCLPPDVPHFAFVGSEVSTYNNILTHGLQALWLAHLLSGRIALPPREQLDADILAQQRWRRKVMPPQRGRGSILQLYMFDYHDQLLRDMGISPRRKGPNPLAECFGIYSAEDYTGIVRPGHRQEHRQGQGTPNGAEDGRQQATDAAVLAAAGAIARRLASATGLGEPPGAHSNAESMIARTGSLAAAAAAAAAAPADSDAATQRRLGAFARAADTDQLASTCHPHPHSHAHPRASGQAQDGRAAKARGGRHAGPCSPDAAPKLVPSRRTRSVSTGPRSAPPAARPRDPGISTHHVISPDRLWREVSGAQGRGSGAGPAASPPQAFASPFVAADTVGSSGCEVRVLLSGQTPVRALPRSASGNRSAELPGTSTGAGFGLVSVPGGAMATGPEPSTTAAMMSTHGSDHRPSSSPQPAVPAAGGFARVNSSRLSRVVFGRESSCCPRGSSIGNNASGAARPVAFSLRGAALTSDYDRKDRPTHGLAGPYGSSGPEDGSIPPSGPGLFSFGSSATSMGIRPGQLTLLGKSLLDWELPPELGIAAAGGGGGGGAAAATAVTAAVAAATASSCATIGTAMMGCDCSPVTHEVSSGSSTRTDTDGSEALARVTCAEALSAESGAHKPPGIIVLAAGAAAHAAAAAAAAAAADRSR